MTALNIAIVLTSYATWTILIYFLRRDMPRITRIKLLACGIALGTVFAALYPLWQMKYGDSPQMVDLYILLDFLVSVPPAFFVYPGRPDKNLFFASTTTPLMVIGHGLGNLAELTVAAGEPSGRLLNLLVMAVCFAAILMGLFWLTRRKFPGLYESENAELWRKLWIITLIMGWMQMLAGNVFIGSSFHLAVILPSRLLCLIGTAAILYIAGLAQRQAEESADVEARAAAAEEAVRQKDEAYARIVENMEETNRLRHDQRQMFTVMQGMNEPGKEKELEAYCREMLAQMRDAEREAKRHEAP